MKDAPVSAPASAPDNNKDDCGGFPAPALAVASALTFPALAILAGNRNQFTLSLAEGALLAGLFFCAVFFVCAVPLCLCRKKKILPWLSAAFLGTSAMLTLQYALLPEIFLKDWPGRGYELDGIFLGACHLLCLSIPLVLALIFRRKLHRHAGKAAAVLILTQAVPVVEMLCSTDNEVKYDFQEYTFSEKGKFTFGARNNVILLVVDAMGERTAKRMLTAFPELREALRDFTCFDKIESPLPKTMFAVPAMLTGKLFDDAEETAKVFDDPGAYTPDAKHARYLDRVCRGETSLLKLFRKHGYKVEGYPLIMQCIPLAPDVIDNSIPITPQVRKASLRRIGEMVMDRQVPFILKPLTARLMPPTGEPFLPAAPGDAGEDGSHDRRFLRALGTEFRTGSHADVFKYLHLLGAHIPLNSDENLAPCPGVERYRQLRGSFKNVELLLARLKEAGLYDRAMIVITGDHTEEYTPETITFIKRPGERHKELAVNSVPCKVQELAGTVAKVCGLKTDAVSIYDRPVRAGNLDSFRKKEFCLQMPPWRREAGKGPLIHDGVFSGATPLTGGELQIEMDLIFSRTKGGFTLRAENVETFEHWSTKGSYERKFDRIRAEKFPFPEGIYRLYIEGCFDETEESNSELRVFPRFLEVKKEGAAFLSSPPAMKPRPLTPGKVLEFRSMALYPELILPARHVSGHHFLELPPEEKLGVRLPPGSGSRTFVFRFAKTAMMAEGTLKITAGGTVVAERKLTGEPGITPTVRATVPAALAAGQSVNFAFEFTPAKRGENKFWQKICLEELTLEK